MARTSAHKGEETPVALGMSSRNDNVDSLVLSNAPSYATAFSVSHDCQSRRNIKTEK